MALLPLRHQLLREGLLVVGLTGAGLAVTGWWGARSLMVTQAKARAQAGLREAERRLTTSLTEARHTGEGLAALGRQGHLPPMGTLAGEQALLTALRSRASLSNLTFVLADGRASAANAPEEGGADLWITRGTLRGPRGIVRQVRHWNPEGRLISEDTDPVAPSDWNQRPWVIQTRAEGRPLWIGPYPFLGRVGFGLTYALPVASGRNPGGVLGVDLVLGDLLSWLREARPTPNTRLAIADGQGRLLIPPEQDQRPQGSLRALEPEPLTQARHPVPAAVHRLPLSEGTEDWTRLVVEGEAYFAQRRRFPIPDGPTWEILAALPEADLLAEPRRVALGTLGVSLLALLILTWRLVLSSRHVAEPLERLARQAEALIEGQAIQLPATTIEEVHRLGRSLRVVSLALEERSALEAQLRQAQRRELVGTLAAGVAHDLGNLLSAVGAHLDRSGTPGLTAEARARSLAQASLALQRSHAFLRALLAVGRREPSAADWKPLDLPSTLREAAALLEPLLGSGIRLALDLPADPLPILGDPLQIDQVVLNLALNGRDAMPRGGTLTLSAGRGPDGRPFLAVRDEGVGIPTSLRERLFSPFFTTKPVDRGSGLGLAMVQGIARSHGAEVEVVSTPGEGSTFTLRFPTAEAIAPGGDPA